MVRKIVNKLLNEVFDINSVDSDKLKTDFNFKFRQKSGNVRVFTFRTKRYKYIVHLEQYDMGFNLISFYPKLNKDFDFKQSRLSQSNQPYHSKYSYQTKENIPFQIFNLLMIVMKDFLKENPSSSFGFFGAPNIYNDSGEDFYNTKRLRIYTEMLRRNFTSTHDVQYITKYSGGLVLNKKVLGENPSFKDYCMGILKSHL